MSRLLRPERRSAPFMALAVVLLTGAFPQAAAAQAPQGGLTSEQSEARLDALQTLAQERRWSFTPTETEVSRRPLSTLTGERPPTPEQLVSAPALMQEAERLLELYRSFAPPERAGEATCVPSAKQWDWRKHGKVTKPKDQRCGDCWAFASAGQIESAFLMAGWKENDLSEQHLLDCSNAGDCDGGWRWLALPWATKTPVADEGQYGYEGGHKNPACKTHRPGTHRLVAASWVDASGDVPSISSLKTSLCEYGPISVSIYASEAMTRYGKHEEEVFDENNNDNGTNHAVLLIGWDDSKQAWLIKNSWSEGWGIQGGYAWVRYGSNNIGRWPVVAAALPPNTPPSEEILSAGRRFEEALDRLLPQ